MQTYALENLRIVEQESPLRNVDSIQSPRNSYVTMAKRLVDISGAALAIIVLWPLMLLIALGVKLSSKGPILFKQQRVGYGGGLFTFFKFRTMSQDSDDLVHRSYVTQLIKGEPNLINNNEAQKPMYKLDDDMRITRLGRILRLWSLDELPQLFNVLKGDMSLVGPRPPIPYEVNQYSAWHLQRLDAVPGITGLWQTTGRSRTTFSEMVRLDIQYIRNWSLWFDFKILLHTLRVVVSREGAL